MNIFVLDEHPVLCAQAHCDKHVVKMLLETAQILCTNLHLAGLGDEAPYRMTHANHPCTVWARESKDNWHWLMRLGFALYGEYQYRYGDKIHKSGEVIRRLPWPDTDWFPFDVPTERPLAMPEQYHCDDVVTAYRNYYVGEKSDILTYTRREAPEWVCEAQGRDSLAC